MDPEQRRNGRAATSPSRAEHLAQIDATTTSRIEAWDAKSLVVAFNAIGWIPVNIFFSAADVLTGASDYLYDYTSNDRPATLTNGKLVRVDSGQFAGQVFRYIGSPLSGSIDLTPVFQNYGNATRWVNTSAQLPVLHDYTSTQTIASLARGKRVLVTSGGHSGQVFKYVGTALTTSTNLSPLVQDYSNIDVWINVTPVFGGQQPSHAQALVIDTPLHAGGNISVTATSGSQLNAIVGNDNVVEAALDLLLPGAQTTTKETNKKTGKVTKKVSGYGASGSAGGIVLASNKASSFARAAIEFTSGQGTVVAAGDVTHPVAGLGRHRLAQLGDPGRGRHERPDGDHPDRREPAARATTSTRRRPGRRTSGPVTGSGSARRTRTAARAVPSTATSAAS